MANFRQVFATIGENQVIRGFYVVRGNTLHMTYGPSGNPVTLDDVPVTAKLLQNSNPDAIARKLARKIYKAKRGEKVEGFDRVIEYPHEAIV